MIDKLMDIIGSHINLDVGYVAIREELSDIVNTYNENKDDVDVSDVVATIIDIVDTYANIDGVNYEALFASLREALLLGDAVVPEGTGSGVNIPNDTFIDNSTETEFIEGVDLNDVEKFNPNISNDIDAIANSQDFIPTGSFVDSDISDEMNSYIPGSLDDFAANEVNTPEVKNVEGVGEGFVNTDAYVEDSNEEAANNEDDIEIPDIGEGFRAVGADNSLEEETDFGDVDVAPKFEEEEEDLTYKPSEIDDKEEEDNSKVRIDKLGLTIDIENLDKRPNWDEYFMNFAILASTRSTCLRRSVGAVIVKDNRIVATGYNGVPTGVEHCDTMGCLRDEMNVPSGERHELCYGLHAEQNAIVSSANFGVSLRGSTIYVTDQPCIICAKMIINSGIDRVVFLRGYPDKLSMNLLEKVGIEVVKFDEL